jgi:hypothetical protein
MADTHIIFSDNTRVRRYIEFIENRLMNLQEENAKLYIMFGESEQQLHELKRSLEK